MNGRRNREKRRERGVGVLNCCHGGNCNEREITQNERSGWSSERVAWKKRKEKKTKRREK